MHQSKKLSKRQQAAATLRPRYFNAQDDPLSLAASRRIIPKSQQHLPIPIINDSNQNQIVPPHDIPLEDGNKREIDGFYLLEVSKTSFPEDLQHIIISDRKLKSVVDEDLTYFSELLYMDVSENFLPLFPFGALPKLRELRIACNRITKIEELFGFNQLMYLDMSYNQLQYQCVEHLYDLPMLKELDLSGNALRHLPSDLFRFESLEKLILQYNKFDENQLFRSFATMPALRYLDVSNNYFSSFPSEGMEDSFKFLDTLDISFNFFGHENDIVGVIYLSRLETFLLYGNPVLGPTGEDPMFIYIEDVVDKANDHRDSIQSTISYIDFVTEIPKKRILKKGEPLGRLALYRDFSIVQVDSRISSKSNREWRRKGIQTIFGEMMAGRRGAAAAAINNANNNLPSTNVTHHVPDYTFITNSIATSNNLSAYQKYQQQQENTNNGGNYVVNSNSGLNEADRNAIADAVMKKVVREMDLTGEEDLKLFESYAKLPPTVVEQQLRKALEDSERHDDALQQKMEQMSIVSGESSIFLHGWLGDKNHEAVDAMPSLLSVSSSSRDHHDSLSALNSPNVGPLLHPYEEELSQKSRNRHAHPQSSNNTSYNLPRDHLPEHLFQTSNIVQSSNLPPSLSLAAQPIALKTAMKALQRALDQPLTSYDAVPTRWSVNEHDYGRHTLTSKMRQQPRIPLTDPHDRNNLNTTTSNPTNNNNNNNNNTLSNTIRSKLQSAGQRGLAEPLALKKLREEARGRTLQQIDSVLDALNASTKQLTAFDRPDGSSVTHTNTINNSSSQGMRETRTQNEESQNHLYAKQNMEQMRTFAKPQPGVKHVMHMVKDILDEFHN